MKADDPLVAHLRALGFTKRTGPIFTRELAPDVIGWLGLNRATRHRGPGEVEINPVVGVRFQAVERVVAECRSEKFHPYLPPTISSPIGYLMPEARYRAWFLSPLDSASVATELAAAVAEYGLPFMRSVVSLDELRRKLDGRFGIAAQLEVRRPVAAWLAGDVEVARRSLEEAVAELGTRSDPAAVELRAFATRLRVRLAE